MSDEEDLLKLKKRYEKGEIPKSRYEEERAWILGTASLLMPGGDMEDERPGILRRLQKFLLTMSVRPRSSRSMTSAG